MDLKQYTNISKIGIIRFILTIVLFLPFICFLLYTLTGFFTSHNNYYFPCSILLLFFFFSFRKMHKNAVVFFSILIIILFINLFFHLKTLGFSNGFVGFSQTFNKYYFFIFLGYILYKYYYKNNLENKLLRLIIYFALFIAVINVIQFIVIYTDNFSDNGSTISFNRYNIFIRYFTKVNPAYYNYLVTGLRLEGALRPAGYFFDTHSQYYLPLGAIIILFFKDLGFKYKNIIVWFLFISVLLSTIKTAYITIIILGLVYMIINFGLKSFLKYSFFGVVIFISLIIIVGKDTISIFFDERALAIFFRILEHLINIPIKLWDYDKFGFIFGGNPSLRDENLFYSEIFLITVTFYIGFIGLLVYLCPLILVRWIKNNKLAGFLYLNFLLSLTHYSVYMVGINYLLSSLVFVYFFAYIEKKDSYYGNIETKISNESI